MATEKTEPDALLRATLASVAPGTELREGLERILRGNTGALVVLGWDRTVESLCSGGFSLDVEFTATRLRELAKMDGAIVVDPARARIVRAAVHLVPDSTLPTSESGTRHRTAQRVARQTGFPVISVSQSMRIVAIYLDAARYVVEAPNQVLSHANQALSTLERYKSRLDQVTAILSALEIEDLATVRDVVTVAQRLEMVRRIADEIGGYVVELGTDGRLLSLQLEELLGGADADRALLVRDYTPGDIGEDAVRARLGELDRLDATELVAFTGIVRALGLPEPLEAPISPRGYRLLAKLPRIPIVVLDRLAEHFGGLQALLAAGIEELQQVDGVGELRARTVREGLSRLAETSFVDRYV